MVFRIMKKNSDEKKQDEIKLPKIKINEYLCKKCEIEKPDVFFGSKNGKNKVNMFKVFKKIVLLLLYEY